MLLNQYMSCEGYTLLVAVQSITQMKCIPRSILPYSINNNNEDIRFSQLFPCVIVTLPINSRISSTHRIHTLNQGYLNRYSQ